MSMKSITRQKNADRITTLVSGVGNRLFQGNTAKGFLYWGVELLLQESSDPPTEDDLLENIVEGKDLGLDCYFVDSKQQTIWLFQAKYRSTPSPIPHKDISDFLKVPERLVDPLVMSASATKAKMVEFGQIFRQHIINGMQIKSVFFTTNLKHTIVNTEVQNWNKLPLHLCIGGSEFPVEHNASIIELDDLLTRFDSIISDKPVNATIALRSGFWHETPSGGFKCLMATIDLEELATLFNTYKYAIFRNNPRGPLGALRVNKAIRDTLGDDTLRTHFHLLNNGLAGTCTGYTSPSPVKSGTSDDLETQVRDLQIVNGCQTTYTVWRPPK